MDDRTSSTDAIDTGDALGSASGNESQDVVDIAGTIAGLKIESDDYARNDDGTIKTNKDGSPRKKRGRKPGAASAPKIATGNKALVNGLNTFSQTLMVVHMGIAGVTKFAPFALDQKEADTLAASVANVMDQFDMSPDPRFTAVAGLVTTSAMIYGPRIYLYADHKKLERKKKVVDAAESYSVANGNMSGEFDPSEFFAGGNAPQGIK